MRQRRNKADPVVVLVPDGTEEEHARWMARFEQEWRANGDPLTLLQALARARASQRPLPEWLFNATAPLILSARGKVHRKRTHASVVRLLRYQAVLAAWDGGRLTWEEAYGRAAKDLAGMFAAAGWRAMKQAYIDEARERGDGPLPVVRVSVSRRQTK